ncbi:hypothetical protein [Pseudomonas sp. Marseille-Q5115]|uniref:hypothetical protein n=1 Tax=Pseudomonas sp. Marseille-Q5115 TaxID=2866593 RepID=UPI001CE3DE77|nr:hypothetical protein [Pseudomonas sp. Marseille-Q5115]
MFANDLFAQQHLGSFAVTDREIALRAIAEGYHQGTEAYDRTVCTGPLGVDGVLPATAHEQGLITKNARYELGLLISRYAGQYTGEEIRRAIAQHENR